MTRLEFLRSLADTVAEARYWVEVCHEDDCEAFREHAATILRQTLKELHLLTTSSTFPEDLNPIVDSMARAIGALRIDDIHGADEALQVAIEHLQALIATADKGGDNHGGQEVVAEADASGDAGAS
jgi:hypothetical protein